MRCSFSDSVVSELVPGHPASDPKASGPRIAKDSENTYQLRMHTPLERPSELGFDECFGVCDAPLIVVRPSGDA